MTGKELLALVRPHDKPNKYSENVARWLNKYKDWEIHAGFSRHSMIDGSDVLYNPTKTQMGNILLGTNHGDGWFNGSRLGRVTGEGTRAERFAFPAAAFKIEPLVDWWHLYGQHGKCHLDPSHMHYPERWGTPGELRQCRWCGFQQKRHIVVETREHEVWMAV